MESFEFLGGRYNRPEQIMSGPVQAFRAQNAATGKTVFIHRVSTTEAPEEQASLLKLLTTALVKSADTRRLLLDFGEERGHWYVVTESEPQCALLREWLQLEIDAAAGNARPANPTPPPPVTRSSTATRPGQTDPGEFTRFLKGRPATPPTSSRIVPPAPPPFSPSPASPQPLPPPAAPPAPPPPTVAQTPQATPPGEFTQFFKKGSDAPPPESVAPPVPVTPLAAPTPIPSAPMPVAPLQAQPAQPPVQRPAPGEFTTFFNASDAERKQQKSPPPGPQRPFNPPVNPAPPPVAATSEASPAQPESGEFTRFFNKGALPPSAAKPAAPPQYAGGFERTQNNPSVQRPNRPVNLPPPSAQKAGEFTQMFSRTEDAKAPAQPPSPRAYQPGPMGARDPMGFADQTGGQPKDLSDQLFEDKLDAPKPFESSKPQQSDFTRMFGSGGAAPPPVQQPSVVAAPRENPLAVDGPGTRQESMYTKPFSLPTAQGSAPAGSEPAANSPSEFTRIMGGGYGAAKPAGGAPPPGSAASGSGSSPVSLNVAGMNPLGAASSHLGSMGGSVGAAHAQASVHGASVGTPLGNMSAHGPGIPHMHVPSANLAVPPPAGANANKKLIIFFAVIGVLAVLLILLMLFVMKNK